MYLLQRMRLGVELRPTPWLTGFAQAQDARVSFADRVPPAPPLQDSLDLRQAYVQFGGESHPLNLRVGRQDLAFGEERLVGASNWGNIARSFDAFVWVCIMAIIDLTLSPLCRWRLMTTILTSMFRATTCMGYTDRSRMDSESNITAIRVLAPRSIGTDGRGSRGHLDSKTIGVRLAGLLPPHSNIPLRWRLSGVHGRSKMSRHGPDSGV